jgi:nucleoside-diphosphate-sugar epimerase
VTADNHSLNGDARRSATAVVTGAAGWLGQNLVRTLAPNRERVRCLVHHDADRSLLSVISPSVDAMVGDVRDPASMDKLFEGIGPATVFHAAGVIHPAGSIKSLFDVNVGGTQLVLDRARRAGVVRFVHVSSNSPFGANPTPTDRFDESSPYNPYMSYGKSKLEAELLVSRSFERGDLQTIILRPPWFYGPFQPARQTQFLAAVRRGRFPLVGDGTQQRSMVYTGNLVLALLLAETAPAAPGHAYWIADSEPYELRTVFETVREALRAEGLDVTSRRPVRVPALVGAVAEVADNFAQDRGRYIQAAHVLGELKDTIACDISRARADLGYDPPTSLLEGMRTSIRWCLANGEPL